MEHSKICGMPASLAIIVLVGAIIGGSYAGESLAGGEHYLYSPIVDGTSYVFNLAQDGVQYVHQAACGSEMVAPLTPLCPK